MLRTYRGMLALTQEELAERSGLSVEAISALERGLRRAPRVSTVMFLAEAMRLDPAKRRRLLAAAAGSTATSALAREPAAAVEPCQLPRSIGDFTGRSAEIARMRQLLEQGHPSAPRVVTVTGAAGVGKTALSLRVAHAVRPTFPDGQFFVDLRGAEGDPLRPADVLAGFLRGLGVEGSVIPSALDELVALYRARSADRRLLVVLDNAAGEAQVRPLLPAGARCAAIVTARAPLGGLEAVTQVTVDVLTLEEAIDLLASVAGEQRAADEAEAAAEIVRLGGHLPLAVRIAGARLATRPRWRLSGFAARLADERRRLDELRVGDLEVRASLALSYRALGSETQQCFRLLGLLETPDFPGWLVAGLLGVEAGAAEQHLERLVDARLLEVSGEDCAAQVRYRLHSLVRLFARELLAGTDVPDRLAALERATGAQLALSERALRVLSPGGARHFLRGTARRWPPPAELIEAVERDPLTWYEAEHASLVAGVAQASRAGLHEVAWELACSMSAYFGIRGHWQDWRTTLDHALCAAQAAGDRHAELQVTRPLGDSYLWLGDTARAEHWLGRALALARELGDEYREALVVSSLGYVSVFLGQPAAARARFEESLASMRRTGDRHSEAIVLTGLGQALEREGRLDEATTALRTSCAMFGEGGDRFWEAVARLALAGALSAGARRDEAERCLRRTIELSDALGNRHFAALGRYRLVTLRLDEQPAAAAIALLEQCVRDLRELGLREEAGARRRLERLFSPAQKPPHEQT
jgi:tetratricopeptide (TPR) repeat protein